ERGEPVAILFASEAAIYGRFGFGLASTHLRLRLRRGNMAMIAAAAGTDGVRLREVVPAEAGAAIAGVYESCLPARPGQWARDERRWHSVLADPEWQRDGMSPLRCLLAEDETGPRGYALYRTRPD